VKRFEKWYLLSQYLIVVIGLVASVIAICSLHSLKHSIDVAKNATLVAEEANRLTRVSERPWVGLGPITILKPLRHGQPLKIRATVQNGGKSPALFLRSYEVLQSTWISLQDNHPPIIGTITECEGKKPAWNKDVSGSILLPGPPEKSFDATSNSLPDEQINFLTRGTPMRGTPGVFGLYLVGCIDYFDK
jgi:hypothetical protein